MEDETGRLCWRSLEGRGENIGTVPYYLTTLGRYRGPKALIVTYLLYALAARKSFTAVKIYMPIVPDRTYCIVNSISDNNRLS